ncbi:MAG: hypothetical protein HY591_04980, partial [Candidatus Omnitrophica bacterium]|nr:hypothetical protein [Candidatus Omnitrophota bacterium]
RAVEFLVQKGLKTSQAVAMLNLMAAKTPPEAREILKPFLNQEDASHLLMLTHGGSPHSYVLIYNELVDQNIGLVFAARRNMQKIEAINADQNLLAAVPAPNAPGFIDFLWDLSGGPPKYSEPLPLVSQNADTLTFREGLNVRRGMGMALINSARYGKGMPASIVFKKDGRVVEEKLANASLNYSVVLYEQNGAPVSRLMDRDLANSLIMRMFFFDGAGLKRFKLLNSASDMTNRTQIKTFEVLWD